jgi:YgiT-type zinc finger domain-containing protein
MKCMICKHGSTVEGTTTVTFEKSGSTIIFKNVPAHICENCGEKYLDDSITRALLKQAQEIVKSGAEVDIRDYIPTAA